MHDDIRVRQHVSAEQAERVALHVGTLACSMRSEMKQEGPTMALLILGGEALLAVSGSLFDTYEEWSAAVKKAADDTGAQWCIVLREGWERRVNAYGLAEYQHMKSIGLELNEQPGAREIFMVNLEGPVTKMWTATIDSDGVVVPPLEVQFDSSNPNSDWTGDKCDVSGLVGKLMVKPKTSVSA